MRRFFLILLSLGAVLADTACSTTWFPNWLRPYRPDVQQGNIVTKDMVDQLRPGMTRDQVHFLLGTPMLTDIFHKDRWDYPYYLRRKSGETQVRKLTVLFDDGKLASYRSDEMPTEPLADNLIIGKKATAKPPAPNTPAKVEPTPGQTPAPAPSSPVPEPAPTTVPAPSPPGS